MANPPLSLFSLSKSRLVFTGFLFLASLFWVLPALAQEDINNMQALAQSRLPVLALVNQGAALAHSPARRSLEEPGPDGLRAFGGFMGGRQEFSGPGHAKVDGFSFMAGLGRRFVIDDSPLAAFTYGFFGEGGTGRIETRQDHPEAQSEGRGRYLGGGLLLKADFQNRVYMDGAFRAGQAVSKLDTFNFGNAPIDRPNDSSSIYFGAVGGLGWLAEAAPEVDLDIYGRLLWSRLGSGEKQGAIEVANLNSTRLVFGARADFRVGEGRLIYAGAAWEHEFNGRAELRINGRPVRDGAVDLMAGSSLVGEVGLELGSAENFSASLGLEGAWGQREALGGLLRLSYVF